MKNQERANALRRQHRQEWLAAGICTVCGKKEALPGRHRCAECARISSERNKRAYKARQAQAKESYYRRKEQGLCVRCGGPSSQRADDVPGLPGQKQAPEGGDSAPEAEEEARWLSEC